MALGKSFRVSRKEGTSCTETKNTPTSAVVRPQETASAKQTNSVAPSNAASMQMKRTHKTGNGQSWHNC